MSELDSRLIRLSLDVGGQVNSYGGEPDRAQDELAIDVQGVKFSNPNQGECRIQITNLSKDVRDFLLTIGTPFVNANREQKIVTVEAGRVSTGLSLLYIGNVFRVTVSQPPDQTLVAQCLTAQFQKSQIISRSFPGNVNLSQIAQQVAGDLGASLQFMATDRQVADYAFTGSATKQVEKINQIIGVDAYLDNDELIVIDSDQSRGRVRVLSPATGLVGIPEPTEQGVKVTMLYENETRNGSFIDLRSGQYPIYNGMYQVYKLNYHLTNRDTPFYLIAECRRL